MELIKILSETVVKNIKRKDLLSEAMSEKVIKQMIDKFSGETEGDPNPPSSPNTAPSYSIILQCHPPVKDWPVHIV